MYSRQMRSHPDEDKRKDFLAFTMATRRTLLVTHGANANLAKVRAMELSDALTILQHKLPEGHPELRSALPRLRDVLQTVLDNPVHRYPAQVSLAPEVRQAALDDSQAPRRCVQVPDRLITSARRSLLELELEPRTLMGISWRQIKEVFFSPLVEQMDDTAASCEDVVVVD